MIDLSYPLTDLHRHLNGSLRVETILELGHRFNVQLPAADVAGLRPWVQVTDKVPDLLHFLAKLDWGVKVLGSLDACARVAYESVEDMAAEGLHYVELRFSPAYMAATHHLPLPGVIDAVAEGVRRGSEHSGSMVRLIGSMNRTYGEQVCRKELEAILSRREHFVALDLAGDELHYPGNLFRAHFNQVRDAGLHVTVHAGEAAGPESIWQAVRELGAERIGHGVNAIKDPALMDYLVKRHIGIESCLTSNLQTGTVTSLADHPLRHFLERGIMAGINTDDPGVQGVDIRHEYQIAAPSAGLSPTQIHQAQNNGLMMAFLSASEKKEIISRIRLKGTPEYTDGLADSGK